MVPAIRNILGGFLFSGDDVYKHVRVLSGGERTRLAVARMLLRPSNTLLLDEPTNHLDLDSKDVLLDALIDYGGTLLFVSHDRYFVERLATKIIEVGNGTAVVYPGTYTEFLWHKEHPQESTREEAAQRTPPRSKEAASGAARDRQHTKTAPASPKAPSRRPDQTVVDARGEKKRIDAEARRKARAVEARRVQIDEIETRIAETEKAIREIEAAMAEPGFYDHRDAAQPVIDRHQALMWQVRDLMHEWEQLQSSLTTADA